MFKKICFLAFTISFAFAFYAVGDKPFLTETPLTVYVGSGGSLSYPVECGAHDYAFIAKKAGESVFIEGEISVPEIIGRYGAKLVFTEQTAEGKSYYCYAASARYLAVMNGKRINLHIFVGDGYAVIGTPVICGGF